MRVLCSAVLAFEWIVLALGIPVAINVAGVPASAAWVAFAVVSVLTGAALALMRTRAGVWLGWLVQVVAVACGFIVVMLGVLGVVFAGLYFAAIRYGRRVDEIRAQRLSAAQTNTPSAPRS